MGLRRGRSQSVKVAICGDNKKEIQEIRKLTNAAAVKLNVYVENLTFSSWKI